MAQRDPDTDQERDPAGAHGSDTGKSSSKEDGPQAGKGDPRRDTPVHSGPTRRSTQDSRGEHDPRSGSACDRS